MADQPVFRVGISLQKDTESAAEEACREASRDWQGRTDLAVLFVSPAHGDSLEKITAIVAKTFFPGVVLGCTGQGTIGGNRELEREPAVVLWLGRLPNVTLTPFRLDFYPTEAGFGVSGWPEIPSTDDRPPVFLILAEPFSTPAVQLLPLIQERYPGAMAIGGMASGAAQPGGNRLVLNDSVFDGGVVGVAMTGDVLVETVVSQGCRPIGERFLITRAEGNVIYELSGQSAFARLQETYASLSPEEQAMVHQGLHLGVTINESKDHFERGDFLVRNLMGADEEQGSLVLTDVVKGGQTVQFHVRDAKTASEDLHELLGSRTKGLNGPVPVGALLFSCNGRGSHLFGRPDHDVTAVHEQLGDIPVAGFFANGEIGPVGGENFLHGFTASIAIFCRPAAGS